MLEWSRVTSIDSRVSSGGRSPASLRASHMLDVRFELLPDYVKEWKVDTRVRFHLGASEIIGRLVLLESENLYVLRKSTFGWRQETMTPDSGMKIYGFTAGDEGMTFLTIRAGDSVTNFTK